MNLHIVPHPSGGNEIPLVHGLPLFDWRATERPTPSPLDLRAERIGKLTGRPPYIVRLHLVAAGLGAGVR